MTLLEPDVTLTDFALAVECALLVSFVRRRGARGSTARFWFVLFFAALGTAALLGGMDHGLVADKQSRLHAVLWSATLIAIGTGAVAGWAIGACLALSPRGYTWVVRTAWAIFAIYVVAVLFVSRSFAVAIVGYLPATAFLLAAFIAVYVRERSTASAVGAAGVVLMFVAAAVQQAGIGLHPAYFNHNALYHTIQGVALLLLYLSARTFIQKIGGPIDANA